MHSFQITQTACIGLCTIAKKQYTTGRLGAELTGNAQDVKMQDMQSVPCEGLTLLTAI